MLEYVQNNIFFTLIIINYIIAIGTAFFIILNNRNPITTVSYILALVVLPFLGLLIYYFLGQEYRKDKMFKRKKVFNNETVKKWEKKLILNDNRLENYETDFLGNKVNIVKLLQNNQKKPLVFGNDVQILINGEKKFEALFKDIKEAKNHIHVEYYMFNDDKIGSQFIEALIKRAKEGIVVRVNYDYVASAISNKSIKKMKQAGIEIFPFMPVWFPNLTRKLNYRNHRKIVVIDGIIGYVGGVNVSDEYVNPNNTGYWRDTHTRLKGNVVKSIQSHFLLNWNFVSEQEIEITDHYFPEVEECGEIPVQIAASGPDSDYPHIMEALFTAINGAKDFIRITTPYFIPNDQMLTALKTASRRGVDIEILIPKEGDSWAAKYATNSYILDLLESGIKVYHYCKGMVHAKTMVVDGLLSTIGTSNMDYRSFEINFEITALIYNKEVSAEMLHIFEDDTKHCNQVAIEEWKQRSFQEKVKESFSRLWAPLL
ncbi:cardiolipin synthase [Mesonia aestuariivivens]|uniref:Cardiolipin synthase n=1 Tax=Mesonia aestuariivivens TaxID=2796128 RepID=A0ABS6W1T6_9FLAO|nr:cardiolipin synthase [Mesonia aestuariivivens]MBW2961496.1 cardiolipin synthase [Mesonia aestuariivivens]